MTKGGKEDLIMFRKFIITLSFFFAINVFEKTNQPQTMSFER